MTPNQNKIEGEISIAKMEKIIVTLPSLPTFFSQKHTVLIHGMGGQTKLFYRTLRTEKSLDLLWTDFSSNSWWTFLLSFVPGQSGLVQVIDRHRIDSLFLDIGSQSTAGLYFVPNHKTNEILKDVVQNRDQADIASILTEENDYFLLTVNFDTEYEVNSDKFYRQFIYGDNLNSEIRDVLLEAD
jgi:hypothetical protein